MRSSMTGGLSLRRRKQSFEQYLILPPAALRLYDFPQTLH
jgi:hypothetical protein